MDIYTINPSFCGAKVRYFLIITKYVTQKIEQQYIAILVANFKLLLINKIMIPLKNEG